MDNNIFILSILSSMDTNNTRYVAYLAPYVKFHNTKEGFKYYKKCNIFVVYKWEKNYDIDLQWVVHIIKTLSL